MGELANFTTATAATNSLNWLFNDNIAQTHQTVKDLRAAGLTQLLNPDFGSSNAVVKRRGTLRYAAWILMDIGNFDETYPTAKFRGWLRWLTWLGKQRKEDFTCFVNGQPVTNRKPARLILEVLQAALPQTGNPTPVSFTWHRAPSGFSLSTNTTTNPMKVDIVTMDGSVQVDPDEEDDV